MQLNSLTITHVRAFEQAELVFQPRINLVVGINGVGKSTVLDTLRFLLAQCLPKITAARNSKLAFDPADDTFNDFIAVQDHGEGNLPGYQWASPNHTNELVPLWAIGAGAERFAEFTRTDLKARDLWGEAYGWTGQYVDNTAVFEVMNASLNR